MKRKFLSLILVLVFFAFAANAQIADVVNKSVKVDRNTTFVKSTLKTGLKSGKLDYVSETFDTEIPATWTINNTGTGSLPGWFWENTDGNFPFTGFAIIDSDANGSGNSTVGELLTPVFDCASATLVNLDFDVRYNDCGSSDVFEVDIWDGSAWQNVISWNEDHGTSSAAEHVSIDISAHVNAACQVRFYYTDGAWDWYAGIDNVSVSSPEADDLGVDAVTPSGAVASGSTFTPTVTIHNYGTNDQATYDVTLVSVPAGYNETVNNPGNITAGSDFVVNFPTWAPADGTYTLTATVVLAGDANPANDVGTSDITVAFIPYCVSSFGAEAGGCPGIETDGTNIYTVYWNPGVSGRNFDKYTMDGTFVEEFEISGVSAVRDMAYNPNTGYFYGAAASTTLWEMDLGAQTLISTITAATECRAIAYDDDDDTFWANNFSSDLIEFDATSGTATGNSFTPPSIYGVAYDNWTDPVNPTLWVLEGTSTGNTPYLTEFDLSGTLTGRQVDLSTAPGYVDGIAGGLASYEDEVGGVYLLANVQQDPNLIVKVCLVESIVETYTVTFTVDDGTDPLQDVSIDIESGTYTATTDVNGVATFDLEASTYSFTVTLTGYTYTGTTTFEVDDQDIDVAVTMDEEESVEEFTAKGINIYPNPSNGIFNINVENNFNLEVLDITGKVVNTQILTGNSTVEINTAGVYFLRFSNEEGSVTQRVIVQ